MVIEEFFKRTVYLGNNIIVCLCITSLLSALAGALCLTYYNYYCLPLQDIPCAVQHE